MLKFRLLRCLLATTLVCVASVVSAETVRLSSLDLRDMTAGWSVAKADREIVGGPLSIHGEKFDHGVGTHAPSKFRVALNGNAARFTAKVGVDDSAGGQGSVEFIVMGDGKTLWSSGVLKGSQAAKAVDVNLVGIQTLVLLVTDGGDGESYDHADWGDARIEMNQDAPVALPPCEVFSLKTRSFAMAFQVGDDGRLYQRPIGADDSTAKLSRDDEFYPQAGDGYVWEPALQVVHADGNTSTALVYDGVTRTNVSPDIGVTYIHLHDPAYPFEVTLCFKTHDNEDVIEEWTEIRHQESGTVTLQRMASTSLLLSTNVYLTHFFGDWGKEMLAPITEKLTPGIKVLDSKLGVRADQFQNPSFVLALNGKTTETNGKVLGGSLAWSGSFQCEFEDNNQAVRALCGVNPFDSAYHLEPNQTLVTPVMIWVWSDHGLGEMSRKLDDWARDFGMRDGHEPREVLLNNWEATGFDYNFDRIASLFPPAKAIGTELFLLDDGWFGNEYPRVGDDAGLGDWQANRKRFPNGLAPLGAEAARIGLRFGIWMEPEMVNPKSILFHEHPNWVIRQPKRELELQRNQLVLDLTRPAVQEFEWQAIKNILSTSNIAYAKWDCNRYLTQPGSFYLAPDRQSELWIDYVRALYALMTKTDRTFPHTELMLCSGGGGRVDYGALKYFDEFWPSDNTDPVTRVQMQWDYSYFFPSMAIASHVTLSGDRPIHFACCVAMSACLGMDLDLTKVLPREKVVLAGAIDAYKRIRDVIAAGDLYRLEDPHGNFRGALDFVSKDRARAVVFVFQLRDGASVLVRPQGLDPARDYTIHELNPAPGRAPIPQEGKALTGAELMGNGIMPSCSQAVEACVVELDSTGGASSENK